MKIGGTPTHNFTLPISEEYVRNVEITYSQNGKIILQKYLRDCTINGNKVSVTLSQLDTFAFTGGVNVEIQIRVIDVGGMVTPSDVICISCDKCLSTEVLI